MRGRCWNPKVVQWGLSPISNNNHNLCQVVTCRSLGISVEPKEHMTQREVSFRYLLYSEKNNTRLLVLGQRNLFFSRLLSLLSQPQAPRSTLEKQICVVSGRRDIKVEKWYKVNNIFPITDFSVWGTSKSKEWRCFQVDLRLHWIGLDQVGLWYLNIIRKAMFFYLGFNRASEKITGQCEFKWELSKKNPKFPLISDELNTFSILVIILKIIVYY